jgi:Protein of unknown function (DUF4239)
MGTVFTGVAMVGGGIIVALLGLMAARHLFPQLLKSEDHGIAGHFFGIVGGFYSILAGFLVVVVWTQFQDAKVIVTREANQIGDLSRLAKAFPADVEAQLRKRLIAYTDAVLQKEWPAMAQDKHTPEAWQALDELWGAYRNLSPPPGREAVYAASLARLTELSDNHRLRLLASQDKIPAMMWALLWLGATVTIFFSYFFRLEHRRAQYVMTAAVAGLITFILLLIIELSHPFAGGVHVSPEAFMQEAERIRSGATE